MSAQADSWAAELQQDVWNVWKSLEDEYAGWEDGFQVFYGPVEETAPILILGINPGGDAEAFENDRADFEAGDFSVDTDHHYLREGDKSPELGDKTLNLLGEPIIRNSVKSNVFFVRSQGTNELDERLAEAPVFRTKCLEEWVPQIITRVDPEVIICEGLRAYDEVRAEVLTADTQECHRREISGRNCRIACRTQTATCPVVGVPHLSGVANQRYNYTDEHHQLMRDTVHEVVERHTDLSL